MPNLSNVRLGAKLGLAIVLPLTIAFALAGYMLLQKWAERNEMARLARLGQSVAGISNLVHHLQRERGASAVFIGSKGAQLAAELPQQRKLTDAERRTVAALLVDLRDLASDAEFRGRIEDAEKAVSALDDSRKKIDAFAITAPASNEYFTSTIARLLAVATDIGKASTRGDVTTAIASYVAFMQGKERSGQERATGAAGISSGKFDMPGYLRVLQLVSAQDTFFAMFVAGASAEDRNFFARVKGDPVFAKVEGFRNAIATGGLSGAMDGLDGATWFHATTARIDLLKTVEDAIAGNLDTFVARTRSETTTTLLVLVAALALIMTLSVLAAVVIKRDISRSIDSIVTPMRALSEGDHSVDIPHEDKKTEIGQMARAVLVFKENMIKARDLAEKDAEAIKQRMARASEVGRLTEKFDEDVTMVLKSVASASSELQTTATSMTATAEETSSQATAVASATEEASTNVQTVSAAAEELTSSITEISRQVAQSAEIARRAVAAADRTNATVRDLSAEATNIGDVVKLINEIASQTNLLALNATIEAARAGEAGRGFAVVASEVKNLAEQTAKATEQIGKQIAAIQGSSTQAVGAIGEIAATINEISEITSAIAAAVEEQSSATQEIARNVQQAAVGTDEIATNVSGVQQAASDTGAAAHRVLGASTELSRQAETLRAQVETFLGGIKAA